MEEQKRRTLEALERRFAQAKAEVQTQQHKNKKRPIEDTKKAAANTESPSVGSTSKRSSSDASSRKDVEFNEPAYLKLSHPVHENLLPNGVEVSDVTVTVNRVLHELLQHGDVARKYIHGSKHLKIENTILLDNYVQKKGVLRGRTLQNASRRSKKHMSLKEHKKNRLFDIPKEFHNFEIFKPMHEKWKGYVLQLLKIVGSVGAVFLECRSTWFDHASVKCSSTLEYMASWYEKLKKHSESLRTITNSELCRKRVAYLCSKQIAGR